MATAVNRLVSGTVATSFLSLQNALTPTGAFMCFAVASLLSVVYIHFCVPETKGRSLEEIEQSFSQGGADYSNRYVMEHVDDAFDVEPGGDDVDKHPILESEEIELNVITKRNARSHSSM